MRAHNIPQSDFWRHQPGLVWSNPRAGDSAHMCAALLRPRFGRLLEIAVEFGLDRVRAEWDLLAREDTPEARRARPSVERILGNIEKGFARASTRN